MAKTTSIIVKDAIIRTLKRDGMDFICITDIARQKNPIAPNGVIGNWMRNRNTVEFLGVWETLNNPHFNLFEFEGFRKEAGLNLSQGERLVKLNQVAIQQMKVLEGDRDRKLLK